MIIFNVKTISYERPEPNYIFKSVLAGKSKTHYTSFSNCIFRIPLYFSISSKNNYVHH